MKCTVRLIFGPAHAQNTEITDLDKGYPFRMKPEQ